MALFSANRDLLFDILRLSQNPKTFLTMVFKNFEKKYMPSLVLNLRSQSVENNLAKSELKVGSTKNDSVSKCKAVKL